ncbi:MAG: C4-dicarboxylate ABC transporter, partial [Rhodospirillales bacterium]
MLKTVSKVAIGAALGAVVFAAQPAYADDACQDGEIKIKFSHVTNTDKHPKGIAASLLEKRVNE